MKMSILYVQYVAVQLFLNKLTHPTHMHIYSLWSNSIPSLKEIRETM